jgi:MFS family permease
MELITGIGLTLLGSSLPALAALWRLDDARSGRLLLAVFAGSAVGALLVRPPFHRNLAAAMAMIAISMAGLSLCNGHALFLLFLLFGTGLGLAMTANSVLTGDRYADRRAAMLTLLNFSWSAGAAVSPFTVQFVIHHAGVGGLFWSMAAAGGLSAFLALLLSDRRTSAQQETSRAATATVQSSRGVVAFFAIFGLLYCGTEAALGGWVLTYVHRLHFHVSAAPPLAASCFWLSLLVGRAVAPAVLLRVREELLLALALICAFVGVAMLLTLPSLPAVMFSAALAGFSMAPVGHWSARGTHRLAAYRAAGAASRFGPDARHDALARRRYGPLSHHLPFGCGPAPSVATLDHPAQPLSVYRRIAHRSQ